MATKPPQPPKKKDPPLTDAQRRENIDKALNKARESNQGTTGGASTGSGSKEYVSGLATSGGKPVTLPGESEPLTKSRIEESRKLAELKKQAEAELNRVERPAEQAARISVLQAAQKQQETPFQQLAERRKQELLSKSGAEAYTAHVSQLFTSTKDGYLRAQVQVSGETKPKVKKDEYGISYRGDNGFLDNVRTNTLDTNTDIQKNIVNYKTPKGLISEFKPSTEQRVQSFIRAKEGTFSGILTGSVYSIYSYGKGYVKGAISFFNPMTYVGIVKDLSNPKQTLESLQTLGPAIKDNPSMLFEGLGYMRGFSSASKVTGNVIKASLAKSKTKLLIEVEAKPAKLSAKEFNFLKKVSEKPRPEVAKALENYKGKGMGDESLIINLNKLSDKNINKIAELQKAGKIESNFEIAISGAKPEAVGFSIKQKREVSKETVAYDKAVSKKFLGIFEKESGKARAKYEQNIIESQKKIINPEMEARIRSEMKKTGKTAAEIYEGIKKEKLIESWVQSEVKSFPKEDVVTGGSASSGFAKLDLQSKGGFKPLYPKQQMLILGETEYIRAMKPLEQIILPSVNKIKAISAIEKIGQVSRSVGVSGITKIPKPGNVVSVSVLKQINQVTPKTELSTKTNTILSLAGKMNQIQRQVSESKQSTAQATKVTQSLKVNQATQQAQKVDVVQIQKQELGQRQIQKIFQKIDIPPRIIIPPHLKDKSSTKKKKKSLFSVQIRRQGKFKPLAQLFQSKQQAEIAQKIQIEKTLAASGRVIEVESGKVARPSIIPKGFYESRKESGVLIQKREERLGRTSERQEIQSAKKRAENIRKIFGGKKWKS